MFWASLSLIAPFERLMDALGGPSTDAVLVFVDLDQFTINGDEQFFYASIMKDAVLNLSQKRLTSKSRF